MPKHVSTKLVPSKQDELLPYCRLKAGDIWRDPFGRHVVGCGDCTDKSFVARLTANQPKVTLAIQDPPYNFIMFGHCSVEEYIEWSRTWLTEGERLMAEHSALYVWLGADQDNHYQPLPQFMQLMASLPAFESRSFITMRNQRGYGTQSNWMSVRQELLYYTKGQPHFQPQYTDIPRILRGYYKTVNGERTENMVRSKSPTIRAGNVWVDVQQVFYRMEENISLCYAQKPLKAIERIIAASSQPDDTVLDFFAHSGTTLLAAERLERRCITCDCDPVFAEVTIRRLERYRSTGKTGWQHINPFAIDQQTSSKCDPHNPPLQTTVRELKSISEDS